MLDLDNALVDRQAAFAHWLQTKATSDPGFERQRHAIEDRDEDGCRLRSEFLAAAVVLVAGDIDFATWDRRLHTAAGAEGLTLIPDPLD